MPSRELFPNSIPWEYVGTINICCSEYVDPSYKYESEYYLFLGLGRKTDFIVQQLIAVVVTVNIDGLLALRGAIFAKCEVLNFALYLGWYSTMRYKCTTFVMLNCFYFWDAYG